MTHAEKISSISARAEQLLPRIASDEFCARDVAQVAALYQEYIDALDEMKQDIEENGSDGSVTIQIDKGAKVKFKDADALAEYLVNIME